MGGEVLHDFDLRLCDYLAANVAEHLGRRTFREELQQDLPRPLFEYIAAKSDDCLLLSDSELLELELVVTEVHSTGRMWSSYPELHGSSVLCIPDIRTHLTKETAEEWAAACRRSSRTLERKGLLLHDGVVAVVKWICELRRLLTAMGATVYLPPPEEAFPTPTCREPPLLASGAPVAVSTVVDKDALLAAITETQALQREVRDLLLTQRQTKEFYSTVEVSKRLGKSEFTVREWCRMGQAKADKRKSYRGGKKQWMIPHEELVRLQAEGPAPVGTYRLPSAEN